MKLQAEVDELERKHSISAAEIARLYERLQHASLTEHETKKQLEMTSAKNEQLQRHLRHERDHTKHLELQLTAKDAEIDKTTNAIEQLRVGTCLFQPCGRMPSECLGSQRRAQVVD